MRIDQFLSHYALLSRKEAGKIIRSGQVSVNDKICKATGFMVNEQKDRIFCQGRHIQPLPEHLTAILYKPPGYLTAARDKKQKTVMDFIPKAWQKIGIQPVGRLDKNTSGALLFTTNGQLAHRLLSPKTQCIKRYLFIYRGDELGERECELVASGSLVLNDGPCEKGRLYPNLLHLKRDLDLDEEQLFRIFQVFDQDFYLGKSQYHVGGLDIHEGRFHQVKRMLLAMNREVVYLHRLQFAGIHMDGLQPGQLRLLDEDESFAHLTTVLLQ